MKNHTLAIGLAAYMLLTATDEPAAAPRCTSGSPAQQAACKHPDVAKELQAQLLRTLKDPESARVRSAKLYESEDGTLLAVCGTVNAKNSYGGYVGESEFISASTELVRVRADEPEAFGAYWAMFCAKPIK